MRLYIVLLRTLVVLGVGLIAILFAQPARAATVPVTNTLDSGPGSLRQAVLDAVPDDTVIFSQDVFSIAQTITLTTGQIEISKSLTIDGAANAVVTPTISGSDLTRVFTVSAGISVTLSRLTIVNGSDYGGAGIYNAGVLTITHSRIANNESLNVYGGGAYNAATGELTLIESTVSSNRAHDPGGTYHVAGIYNDGRLTVISSTVDHNDQQGIFNGGVAIVVASTLDGNYGTGIGNGGTLSVSNTVFVNNVGSYSRGCIGSGGIGNGGTASVVNSTFAGNSACTGGGILNYGTLSVINSTFTGNHAFFLSDTPNPNNISGKGAAISNIVAAYSTGALSILNSTFSGNEADISGGGIYNEGTVTLTNSIIANSVTSGNCSGIFVDGGHNLEDANTCGFSPTLHSLISTTAMLGPVQANSPGQAIPTMALLFGSPAINAGDDAACPATDERGVHRPIGQHCDIGAYEAPNMVWLLQVMRHDKADPTN